MSRFQQAAGSHYQGPLPRAGLERLLAILFRLVAAMAPSLNGSNFGTSGSGGGAGQGGAPSQYYYAPSGP